MGNIHVKFGIWTSSSEGDVVYRHFLSRALAAFVQRTGTICRILVEGIIRNDSVKLF